MEEESENDVDIDLLELDFVIDGSLDRMRGVLDRDLTLLVPDLGDLDTDLDLDLDLCDLDLALSDLEFDLERDDRCLLCLDNVGDLDLDLDLE